MNKVIITGANGFIGKKLIYKFLQQGDIVEGWDCINENHKYIRTLNLRDEEEILEHLDEFKPNIIIHCAGNADVTKSVKFPGKDYDGNVTLTHNLLFAMHKLGMRKCRFVFLSSAGVYGNPQSLPIRENAPLNPLSPYALHKVMCEDLCLYFVNNYGADIKIARIFSAYGNGLRKQIFWDMHNKYIETGRLDMYGTGNESRDYIHVNDVVNAIFLLATTKSQYTVFNVANGEELTIRQVTEIFARESEIALDNIAFNGLVREGDPLNWKADISKIKEIGYIQSVTIDEGLKSYCSWLLSE